MNNVLFIADFFAHRGVKGGGELNNDVLIKALFEKGVTVRSVHSHQVSNLDLAYSENIIVSNFVNLSEENKYEIQNKKER